MRGYSEGQGNYCTVRRGARGTRPAGDGPGKGITAAIRVHAARSYGMESMDNRAKHLEQHRRAPGGKYRNCNTYAIMQSGVGISVSLAFWLLLWLVCLLCTPWATASAHWSACTGGVVALDAAFPPTQKPTRRTVEPSQKKINSTSTKG